MRPLLFLCDAHVTTNIPAHSDNLSETYLLMDDLLTCVEFTSFPSVPCAIVPGDE
jgi:hypothetical protein